MSEVTMAAEGQAPANQTQLPAPGGRPPINPADITQIAVDKLTPAPWNARRHFDREALEGLGLSLRETGQIEPIVVRPSSTGEGERYEIVAGERRYRAAQLVGLPALNAVIIDVDDHTARQVGLDENLSRENLSEWEELHGILDLLSLELSRFPGWPALVEERGSEKEASAWIASISSRAAPHAAPQALAALEVNDPTDLTSLLENVFAAGRSVSITTFRTKRLTLLTLPEDLQEGLSLGKLTVGQARALRGIADEEQRAELMERAIKEKWTANELSTVVAKAKADEQREGESFATQMRSLLGDINRWVRHVDRLPAREQQRFERHLTDMLKTLSALQNNSGGNNE